MSEGWGSEILNSAGRRMRAGSTLWPHCSLCVLVAEKKPPRAQRMEGLGLCLCVVKLALAGVEGACTAMEAAL